MKATVIMARTEHVDGFELTVFDEAPEELATLDNAVVVSGFLRWTDVERALDEGRTVLDPVLGFSLKRLGTGLKPLSAAGMLLHPEPSTGASGDYWYVDRLGGWPQLTGRTVRVAVLDVGCGFRHCCLPAMVQHVNFGSAAFRPPDCASPSEHGTKCAGVIGARDLPAHRRIGVAPGAELGFGEVIPEPSTGRIDLFLMLSWAITFWGARVVSHSRAVRVGKVAPWAVSVMAHIAGRARRHAGALIFSSAGNDPGPLQFPALVPDVIAVGAYNENLMPRAQSGLHDLAVRYDALLGPGSRLQTIDAGSGCDLAEIGATSAACAFVAGCAALYYEWFRRKGVSFTADEVYAKMVGDAEVIRDGSGLSWRGVSFPK